MMHIAEIVRRWTGWCPHASSMHLPPEKKAKATFSGGIPSSDGNGGSVPGPGSGRYRHTQVGRLIVYAVGIVCMFSILSLVFVGFVLPIILVAVVLVVTLSLFATLTISINRDELVMHFGPLPLIRKRIRVAEIISAIPVKNPWYYGWGIHFTPYGWLYNVSGEDAVEFLLASGKTLRIGTDEPETLAKAIRDAAQ